jgi:ABC-type branched-subunit amino acid transport system permease subunit
VEILFVAIAAVAVGILLTVMTGQPLAIVIGLIAGGLLANRIGYRHQAKAIRRELDPAPAAATTATRTVEQRLAELERMRSAGSVTDAEYAEKRSAILADL